MRQCVSQTDIYEKKHSKRINEKRHDQPIN